MKKAIILSIICLLQIQSLFADNVQNIGNKNCNTNINDRGKQAFITFYGDSLGDLIDFPTHGAVGWDAYLGFFRPDIDWRVQNFATINWTTRSIYDALINCLENKTVRENFKTSNSVAFEIGGNDMVNYTPILIIMPWKYWTYTDPTTKKEVKGIVDVVLHNIKVLIYFFRHPLWDKNVLVMGNFPTFSYSPTLGHVGDYFDIAKDFNLFYDKWNEDVRSLQPFHVQEDDMTNILDSMQEAFIEDFPTNFFRDVISGFFNEEFYEAPGKYLSDTFEDYMSNHPSREEILGKHGDTLLDVSSTPDWYFEWIYTNSKSPLTATSIGLLLMQPGLETLVNQMREETRNWKPIIRSKKDSRTYTPKNRTGGNYVEFLSLYPLMVRAKDCIHYGSCWVANPILYRDFLPGHINHLGYYVWAKALADKFSDLEKNANWEREPLRFNGIIDTDIPFDDPIVPVDKDGNEVKPEEPAVENIDWLILLCFIFGKCGF